MLPKASSFAIDMRRKLVRRKLALPLLPNREYDDQSILQMKWCYQYDPDVANHVANHATLICEPKISV